jgi:uncharacterized protein involved in exopolysaccharide biosynthesis
MRSLLIVLACLVVGLLIGFAIWSIPPVLHPQYTARTFIKVTPASEIPSIIDLIRYEGTFNGLLDRDKVQQTDWFQGLSKIKDQRFKDGVAGLKKHICVKSRRGSDLVKISMTCSNADDAAEIVNEFANMFISTQGGAKRKQVADNLAQLEVGQVRLQRDLELAETAMDTIRRRYGFSDLEQHSYPHPLTERLMRLQQLRDDCAVEIAELNAVNDQLLSQPQTNPSEKSESKQTPDLKDVQFQLRVLRGKLAQLDKMREEAAKRQEELDLARAHFDQRLVIRDERKAMLDSIKSRIEELKILYDSPDTPGLQSVPPAPTPVQPDCPPWQIHVLPAGLAGLILGIIVAWLTKKPAAAAP